MARFSTHKPITIERWKGLYSRGKDDNVPSGYLSDTRNVQFNQNEVLTRDGNEQVVAQNNVRRFFIYKRLNETSRYLYLTTDGSLYDSLYPATPLITDADFEDFSAVNYFNRAYITFHDRESGINGSYLYVYQGAGPGTLRPAAGTAPTGFTLTATNSASSGNVEAGTHIFAVAYETDSGYLTAPGPTIFATVIATGTKKVTVGNLPVGPSGTVARWILATRAITTYDGNQFGYELYFVERVGDNVTTSYDVNFYDADLFSSADYLFDNRATIPAGLGVTAYNNSLIIWGIQGFEHYVFVSKQAEPEVFDETAGFILVDPSDSITGVRNAVEFRNQLYIATSNRFYVTVGNTNAANTWGLVTVDKSVGTEVFGISKVLDARGSNTDRFFVADRSGLLTFEASRFSKPALSYNIENVWKRINKTVFNLVQVDHDPESMIIYIAVPMDSATECSHILMADYSQALIPEGFIAPGQIKWSIYDYPWTVSSISCDLDALGRAVLYQSGLEANIYRQVPDTDEDDGEVIPSHAVTWYQYLLEKYVHNFNEINFRIWGTGTLAVRLFGEDNVKITLLPNSITLAENPGKNIFRTISFENEKMAIKVSLESGHFTLQNVTTMGKPIAATRPR